MPMPALLQQNATGTAGPSGIWQPDWLQDPFSIGFGTIVAGGSGMLVQLEYTLDNLDSPTATTVGLTWYTLSSSIISTSGSFSTPCKGIRLNIQSATATSVVVVNLIQATFPR